MPSTVSPAPAAGFEARFEAVHPGDPRLDPFRDLPGRTRRARRDPSFVAEGELLVLRLLASPLEVEAVLATDGRAPWLARALDDRARAHPGLPRPALWAVAPADLRAIAGVALRRGCVALARRPALRADAERALRAEADNAALLRAITAALEAPAPAQAPPAADPTVPSHPTEGPPPPRATGRLVLALDRVTDPKNVGALLRTASAFGCDLVLLGPGCGDPWDPRALRASMGAPFDRPPLEVADLPAALAALRQTRPALQVLAALAEPDATPVHDLAAALPAAPDLALVLGNEGHGLTPAVRATCDHAVTVPITPGVDSLNVAAAGAVLLAFLRGWPSGPTPQKR